MATTAGIRNDAAFLLATVALAVCSTVTYRLLPVIDKTAVASAPAYARSRRETFEAATVLETQFLFHFLNKCEKR